MCFACYWLVAHVMGQCGFLAEVPKSLSRGFWPQIGSGHIQESAQIWWENIRSKISLLPENTPKLSQGFSKEMKL